MLEVKQAEYAGNYAVNLLFSNGRRGTADLEQVIFSDKRKIFVKLREKGNFINFKIAHSAVVWNDELDIASEYLFYLTFKDDQDLQDIFRQWGYVNEPTPVQEKKLECW